MWRVHSVIIKRTMEPDIAISTERSIGCISKPAEKLRRKE